MKEIRHDPKFEKFGAGAVLKHIGDQLAELLYGDGKTFGTTKTGIFGKCQAVLVKQHKLLDEHICN